MEYPTVIKELMKKLTKRSKPQPTADRFDSPDNHDWVIQANADINHPNRKPFTGVLTTLDIASDSSPSGARGHKVILTRKAAEAALPSLIGMAVDYKADWDGHDARQKCGVITSARIEENELIVSGYLYARDFPSEVLKLSKDEEKMGMSYELADAHVADMRRDIWKLTRVTFTGAAILLKTKAAYKSTSFRLQDAA